MHDAAAGSCRRSRAHGRRSAAASCAAGRARAPARGATADVYGQARRDARADRARSRRRLPRARGVEQYRESESDTCRTGARAVPARTSGFGRSANCERRRHHTARHLDLACAKQRDARADDDARSRQHADAQERAARDEASVFGAGARADRARAIRAGTTGGLGCCARSRNFATGRRGAAARCGTRRYFRGEGSASARTRGVRTRARDRRRQGRLGRGRPRARSSAGFRKPRI